MRMRMRRERRDIAAEVEQRIAQITASLAMEGMEIKEKSKEDMRAVLSGVTTADELIRQINRDLKIRMGKLEDTMEEVRAELERTSVTIAESITESMASVDTNLREALYDTMRQVREELKETLDDVKAELDINLSRQGLEDRVDPPIKPTPHSVDPPLPPGEMSSGKPPLESPEDFASLARQISSSINDELSMLEEQGVPGITSVREAIALVKSKIEEERAKKPK